MMIYEHIISGRSFRTPLPLPFRKPHIPHNPALHVGLKSFAPSGHLRNIPLPLPLTGVQTLLGVLIYNYLKKAHHTGRESTKHIYLPH
ncbi:hypothetical protein Barb4_05026 [Bacteroidales bacterium Barb4]|nr:hypothetical protein Barb4_05026 [Bacteroidales bacterium Barb4]